MEQFRALQLWEMFTYTETKASLEQEYGRRDRDLDARTRKGRQEIAWLLRWWAAGIEKEPKHERPWKD